MPASRRAGSPKPTSIRSRPRSRWRPRPQARRKQTDLPRKKEPSEPNCIVPREQKPTAAMIRFAIAPDGEVVADLRRRLPGRGVWVTAKSGLVETAVRKHLFQRGFGEPVKVEPDLARRVAAQLQAAAEG